MKIGIIGGLGVGVAHVLAVSKISEVKQIDVYDINPLIENFYSQPIIENSWGMISDYIENPGYINTFISDRLIDEDYDLVVIATPNNFHFDILNDSISKSKKILVEKPMVGLDEIPKLEKLFRDIGNSTNKIYSGFEWLHHDYLIDIEACGNRRLYHNGKRIRKISMVHGYPPKGFENNSKLCIVDLGIHLLSLLQFRRLDLPVKNITVTNTVNLSICRFDDWDFELEVGYDKDKIGEECNIEMSLDGAHSIFEWIPFEDGDLFYRQMQSILFDSDTVNLSFKKHIDVLKQLKLWYNK